MAPRSLRDEITLDDLLARERRAKASKLASEILGKARFDKDGKPKRLSSIGSIVKPTSIHGISISNATARALQGNRLFEALHPEHRHIISSLPPPRENQDHHDYRDHRGDHYVGRRSRDYKIDRYVGTGNRDNRDHRDSRDNRDNKFQRDNRKHRDNSGSRDSMDNKNNWENRGKYENTPQVKIRGAGREDEINIRGVAVPTQPVIQASNFAPGTTQEDIKHAMMAYGTVLSCLILTTEPVIVVELIFETIEQCQRIVQKFNGVTADGRKLSVSFKTTPAVGLMHLPDRKPILDPYAERIEADRQRRVESISYTDGSYGMAAPPIYSDALLRKGRGFLINN
ncbi:hypothetical protein BZA77DRAFT_390099 [Pyronema omphalodes]|nr:hypothetical protein BZA77DRAFT_390099 [Pyronema omphalodes]